MQKWKLGPHGGIPQPKREGNQPRVQRAPVGVDGHGPIVAQIGFGYFSVGSRVWAKAVASQDKLRGAHEKSNGTENDSAPPKGRCTAGFWLHSKIFILD